MYDTAAEANQKLQNTAIMRDEDPIWVGPATGSSPVMIAVRKFKDENWKSMKINDPSLNMKELGDRLGYVNIRNGQVGLSVYTRRTPVRKAHQTQGLSDVNVYVDKSHTVPKFGISSKSWKLSYLLTIGLEETMKKKFPTLSMVRFKMSKDETLWECAFDPCLAVCRDGNNLWKLHHKGIEIGWTDDLHIFKVAREYRYLDELLVEEHKMNVRS